MIRRLRIAWRLARLPGLDALLVMEEGDQLAFTMHDGRLIRAVEFRR